MPRERKRAKPRQVRRKGGSQERGMKEKAEQEIEKEEDVRNE